MTYSTRFKKHIGVSPKTEVAEKFRPILDELRKIPCRAENTADLRIQQQSRLSHLFLTAQVYAPNPGENGLDFIFTKGTLLSAVRDLIPRYIAQNHFETARLYVSMGLLFSAPVPGTPDFFQDYRTRFSEFHDRLIPLATAHGIAPLSENSQPQGYSNLQFEKKYYLYPNGAYTIVDSAGLIERQGQIPTPFSYTVQKDLCTITCSYKITEQGTPYLDKITSNWTDGSCSEDVFSFSDLPESPWIELHTVIKSHRFTDSEGREQFLTLKFSTERHALPLELYPNRPFMYQTSLFQRELLLYPDRHFFIREDNTVISYENLGPQHYRLNGVAVSFGTEVHQIPIENLALLYRCHALTPEIAILVFKTGPGALENLEEHWIVNQGQAADLIGGFYLESLGPPSAQSKSLEIAHNPELNMPEYFIAGCFLQGDLEVKYTMSSVPDLELMCNRVQIMIEIRTEHTPPFFQGSAEWDAHIPLSTLLEITQFHCEGLSRFPSNVANVGFATSSQTFPTLHFKDDIGEDSA